MRTSIAVALALVLALVAGCDDGEKKPETGPEPAPKTTPEPEPKTEPAPAAAPQVESVEGLKKLMTAALAAVKDENKLKQMCAELVVPAHEKFFTETFGAEKGKPLAAEYGKDAPQLAEQLPALFRRISAKGQTEVNVLKLTDPASTKATGLQQSALKAMKKKTALYSVRFLKPGDKYGMHIWSFVFADGKFRLAGKMRPLSD